MNKYKVTWMLESETNFEIDMTKSEIETIKRFIDYAYRKGDVPSYDIPSIDFEELE